MAFGGPRSSCVRPGAHSARHQDSRNDWTPCRIYAFAGVVALRSSLTLPRFPGLPPPSASVCTAVIRRWNRPSTRWKCLALTVARIMASTDSSVTSPRPWWHATFNALAQYATSRSANVKSEHEVPTKKPPELSSSTTAKSAHGIGPPEIRGQGDLFSSSCKTTTTSLETTFLDSPYPDKAFEHIKLIFSSHLLQEDF